MSNWSWQRITCNQCLLTACMVLICGDVNPNTLPVLCPLCFSSPEAQKSVIYDATKPGGAYHE